MTLQCLNWTKKHHLFLILKLKEEELPFKMLYHMYNSYTILITKKKKHSYTRLQKQEVNTPFRHNFLQLTVVLNEVKSNGIFNFKHFSRFCDMTLAMYVQLRLVFVIVRHIKVRVHVIDVFNVVIIIFTIIPSL